MSQKKVRLLSRCTSLLMVFFVGAFSASLKDIVVGSNALPDHREAAKQFITLQCNPSEIVHSKAFRNFAETWRNISFTAHKSTHDTFADTLRVQSKYSGGSWSKKAQRLRYYNEAIFDTTTVYQDWIGNNLQNNSKTVITYDQWKFITMQTDYSWGKNNWQPELKISTTFPSQLQMVELYQLWDTTLTIWYDVLKIRYDADNNFLLKTVVVEAPVSPTQWDTVEQDFYTYTNFNLTQILYKMVPQYGGTLPDYLRETFTYDNSDNLTKHLWELKGRFGWYNDSVVDLAYSGDLVTEEATQKWDTLGNKWVNSIKTLIYYNALKKDTLAIEQIWSPIGNAWVNDKKYTVLFNANNVASEVTRWSWTASSSIWAYDLKTEISYKKFQVIDPIITSTLNTVQKQYVFLNKGMLTIQNHQGALVAVTVVNLQGKTVVSIPLSKGTNHIDLSQTALKRSARNVWFIRCISKNNVRVQPVKVVW